MKIDEYNSTKGEHINRLRQIIFDKKDVGVWILISKYKNKINKNRARKCKNYEINSREGQFQNSKITCRTNILLFKTNNEKDSN